MRLRYLIGVLLLASLRRLLQPRGATDGLEAEEELRRSRELYRVVVEHTDELIAPVDVEGVYSYVSPSYKRVLGHAPADLVGRNAFELLHPDDLPTGPSSRSPSTSARSPTPSGRSSMPLPPPSLAKP